MKYINNPVVPYMAGTTSKPKSGKGNNDPKVWELLLRKVNPTEVLNNLIDSCYDYAKTAQEEKSKRVKIEAETVIELEEIRSKREILMAYLDRSFDERKENFSKFFEVLDNAMETGNTQIIGHALSCITDLAKSSPFKDLATIAQVRNTLSDPNGSFDF